MWTHWWHVPLSVTPRGLTTTSIPYGTRAFEGTFDFIDHRLIVETSDGETGLIALRPQTVVDFYREYLDTPAALDIAVALHGHALTTASSPSSRR